MRLRISQLISSNHLLELTQPQDKIVRSRSPFTRETKIEIAKRDSQAHLINRRCGDDLGEIVRKPLKVTKYLLILAG